MTRQLQLQGLELLGEAGHGCPRLISEPNETSLLTYERHSTLIILLSSKHR
jgi:hypothetical protein